MKTNQEQQFEVWFQAQPFYSQQVFSHGERLFIKDGDDYKQAAVRTAFAAFKNNYSNQSEVDRLQSKLDRAYFNFEYDAYYNRCKEQKIMLRHNLRLHKAIRLIIFFAGLSLVLFMAFLAALGNCS